MLMDGEKMDDREFLQDYFARIATALTLDRNLEDKTRATRDIWLSCNDAGGRVIFVGNGGSAAISSHLAIDLSKNAGVPGICFSDSAMITCLANDFGFENWISAAVRIYGRPEDCLVAISSSGRSSNILSAVDCAKDIGMKVENQGLSQRNRIESGGGYKCFT